MKNLAKFFMVVAIFAGITSCVQDATVDEGGFLPTETITISVAESRTHLGEKDGDSYPVYWSTGDQVSINGVSSDPLGETAEGSVKGLFNFTGLLEPTYKASYPATAEAGKVYFAPEQTYVAGTFSEGAAVLYGESETLTIQMQHASGVLKFPIKIAEDEEVSLKRVVIENVNGKLAGEYSAELVDGEVVVTPSESATNKIVYDCGNVALSTEPTNLFIAVPAGEYAELKVSLVSTDNRIMNFKVTAAGEKKVKAGIVREFNKVNHISFTGNETTFQITDSESLMEFAELCAKGDFLYSGAKVMNSFTFDSATYTWAPVTGFVDDLDFDGGDFTITGLPNALFDVANGNIHNLKLNSTVVLSDENAHHGLLANQFSGTVTDCEVSGSIEHTALKDVADVAGVVGAAGGKLVFTNVANKASVKATFVQDAAPKLAGILGTSSATGALEFINCSNSGSIGTVATSGVTTKMTYIGGIFGDVTSNLEYVTMKGCANSGNITSNHDSAGVTVGGLYARNGAAVSTELYNETTYNTNAGDITVNGTISAWIRCGGCIGHTDASNTSAKYLKNLEGADLTINALVNAAARIPFGGVIGHFNIAPSTVEHCYNYGTVTYNGTMEHTGSTYFSPTVGGVIGYTNQTGHSFKNLHNHGAVSCTSTQTFKRFKIAGVIAYLESGNPIVEDCSNNVDLTLSGNSGHTFYGGGVLGHVEKAGAVLKNLTNNNKITFEGTAAHLTYIGGVVGDVQAATAICSNLVNIGEVINNRTTSQDLCCGGVAGRIAGTIVPVEGGTIGAKNTGAVTLGGSTAKAYYGGGVVGLASGPTSYVTNEGTVTFPAAADAAATAVTANIGGAIGALANTITSCSHIVNGKENSTTLGKVEVPGTAQIPQVGGCVGLITLAAATEISDLTNYGEVAWSGHGSYATVTNAKSNVRVGGVAGSLVGSSSSASNFTNRGKLDITGTFVNPYPHFGGVVASTESVSLDNFDNHGEVVINFSSSKAKLSGNSHESQSAGIVGNHSSGAIKNCDNHGAIQIKNNCANLHQHVGGIAAYMYTDDFDNNYNRSTGTITSYASHKTKRLRIGGLVGVANATSLKNSGNEAKIDLNTTQSCNQLLFGGCVGYVYSRATTYTKLTNSGALNVNTNMVGNGSAKKIGGIAGTNNVVATFSECKNTGNITVCPELGEGDTFTNGVATVLYIAGITTPYGETKIATCTECEFDATITAPSSWQTQVAAIVGWTYMQGWATGCKVDGAITKGGETTADITDSNFHNFVFISGAPADWGTQDPAYEGNYGVKTELGDVGDDL